MHTYRLSPSGRRTTIVLLVAALAVWAFAIWTFRSTVGTLPGDENVGFFDALRANLQNGLGISQLVPALLTLALIVATPLVLWNLFQEYGASYTPTDDGLRYEAPGVALTYPWTGIQSITRSGTDEEPADTLVFDRDYTGQIGNRFLRWLHAQAHGRTALPIHAGLERRAELIDEVALRTGLSVPTPDTPHLQGATHVEPTESRGADHRA